MDLGPSAASGNLLVFALAVAGSLIGVLVVVVVFFVRLRVKDAGKEKDILERRLAAGAVKMERLETDLHSLNRDVQKRVYEGFVTKTTFERAQKETTHRIEAVEHKIESIRQGQTEALVSLAQIQSRVDAGFKHVTSLLAQKIEIKNSKDPM